jgi:hypothetical protein
MLTTSKWLAIIAMAFVVGSFVASPELRAFAANTVGSGDIINESILSEDIKNSQVKAADIATDAVGAAELQGVTKLLFAKCLLTSTEANTLMSSGVGIIIDCDISGVTGDDQVMATFANGSTCLAVTAVTPHAGDVSVALRNVCPTQNTPGANSYISLIVYHK